MGLYLCIFDGDDEIDGVDVGAYSDFGVFRNAVRTHLESGYAGAKYPTLMLHSDCDGEWTVEDCKVLEAELEQIGARFKELPAEGFEAEWQKSVAKSLGLKPGSLYDCFIDVDGEPLVERLIYLCRLAQKHGKPILFQ
jgi:hypothetical protein